MEATFEFPGIKGVLNGILNKEGSQAVARAALETIRRARERSPVDTGFYRSRHHLTMDTANQDTFDRDEWLKGNRNFPDRVDSAERNLAVARNYRLNKVLTARSDAVYARHLEFGTTRTEPRLVQTSAVDEVTTWMENLGDLTRLPPL